MASHFSLLPLFLLFNLCKSVISSGVYNSVTAVSSELVPEEGYTVNTVIDGHKLNINPHAILPRPGSSDLILLDSSGSVFYTISSPLSPESEVKRLSGEGIAGHRDGVPGHAQFNKPKSFAVDAKGNVYVADKNNHAIRKIDTTGAVTTIAGGYSNKTGNKDGPAQNATFSDDFEVVFVPGRCILLVADHGNQLLRQIDLKADDCAIDSTSGSALRAVTIWTLALGLSCLFGLVIGIAVRPYIIPHTARHQHLQFQRDMEALPNQSGETSTDVLLRHQKRSC